MREVEDPIPLEVVVRNVAAGSLSTRLGLEEGTQLPRSIIEFYYKNDQLNDPMVSEEHITAFGWAAPQEIDDIMALAIRVNDFPSGTLFVAGVGIRLVPISRLKPGAYGRARTCALCSQTRSSPVLPAVGRPRPTTSSTMKDRFRKDLDGMIEAYTEVARRLGVMQEGEYSRATGPRLVK